MAIKEVLHQNKRIGGILEYIQMLALRYKAFLLERFVQKDSLPFIKYSIFPRWLGSNIHGFAICLLAYIVSRVMLQI